MNYQDYPKWLSHPSMQPAIVSSDPNMSRPLLYGPVLVNSEDQQKEYEAKGYVANGAPNPKAFEAVFADREKVEVKAKYQEYPKWIKVGVSPNGDPIGKIVKNAEEEALHFDVPVKRRKSKISG